MNPIVKAMGVVVLFAVMMAFWGWYIEFSFGSYFKGIGMLVGIFIASLILLAVKYPNLHSFTSSETKGES